MEKLANHTTDSLETLLFPRTPVSLMPILTPLFDRFELDRPAGMDELARDIADLLGARRAHAATLPGVLNWGLPGAPGMTPASEHDRRRIAGFIADALERHEPRLEAVRITPTEHVNEFSFEIEASLIQTRDSTITLRILSPRRGGGLGAEVAVLGVTERDEQ